MEVIRIPQSSSITGTSPSDSLVLYPGHSFEGVSYLSVQSVYFKAQADCGRMLRTHSAFMLHSQHPFLYVVFYRVALSSTILFWFSFVVASPVIFAHCGDPNSSKFLGGIITNTLLCMHKFIQLLVATHAEPVISARWEPRPFSSGVSI